jgi:hypothetical protein
LYPFARLGKTSSRVLKILTSVEPERRGEEKNPSYVQITNKKEKKRKKTNETVKRCVLSNVCVRGACMLYGKQVCSFLPSVMLVESGVRSFVAVGIQKREMWVDL